MNKDESVEEWFDRVMGEIAPEPPPETGEIVFTEDDVLALFSGVPKAIPGIIYFDDRSGAIRGVSHGLETELADRFPYIEVEAENALSFMSGDSNIADWMVGYQGDPTPVLMTINAEKITIMPSARGYEVVNDTVAAPVQFVVVVPRGETVGSIIIEHQSGMEVEAGFTEPFDIMLTKKASPDDIVAQFKIDPVDLFSYGELPLDLGRGITVDLDLVTKPLTSVQYRVQHFYERTRPIPLPSGRFEEFRPFKEVHNDNECRAGLLVEYDGREIVVSLVEGGGRFYDRPVTALLLAFCRPNNKEALLWRTRVPLEDILSGPVRIPIETPITEEFDVISQLYFAQTFYRDLRADNDVTPVVPPESFVDLGQVPELPEEGIRSGLILELDPAQKKISAKLHRGGGKPYQRELDEMVVSFSHPENIESVIWTTRLKLSDIRNGTCVVDAPAAIFGVDFVVHTQMVYVNTFYAIAKAEEAEIIRTERVGDSHWLDRRVREGDVPPPCLAVWLERGRNLLRVQALNGGGTLVKRGETTRDMRIVICSTRDPETMICVFNAPISRLEKGDMIGFPLPVEWHPELVNGNFEVLVQSVYTRGYIFD